MSVSFTDMTSSVWMTVEYKRATGRGLIVPSIFFDLEASTPQPDAQVELHHLRGRLYQGSEYLGQGSVEYRPVSTGTSLEMQIPLALSVIDHISKGLTGANVDLSIRFDGVLRICSGSERAFVSSPEPGAWTFLGIGSSRSAELNIQIPRSDWFKNVVEPTSMNEYVFTEIRIPAGVLESSFRAAADSILKAERHFIAGDDPEVFFQCRAAIESLQGAPKNIFESITDDAKRKTLNDFVKGLNALLHRGRHAQPERGFSINHQDAELALSATKVALGYVSKNMSG